MRYPKTHKSEVRARIVEATARALRMHGVEGVGIPALMKQAGLTHGAFYTHFESRDALVAEAVRRAADETARSVFANGVSLRTSLRRYLSPRHVAHPAEGCVVAALGTDGPRHEGAVKRAFAHAAAGLIRLVDRKRSPSRAPGLPPSDAALAQAATMVGAVVLARLVDDPALMARLLAVAARPR